MANIEGLKKATLLDCDNALKYYKKIANDEDASEIVRNNAEREIKRIIEIKKTLGKY